MARAEVWEAMIRERIILFQALIRKLDRQPENNPAARWRATVGLTTDYCPENRPGRMSEVHSTAAVFNLGQVFFEIRPAAPAVFPGDSKRKFCWFISCIGSRRCFFRLYFAGPLCFHPGGISLASRTIIKMLRHRVVQIQEPYNGRDTWNLRQVFATDFCTHASFSKIKLTPSANTR